MSCELSLVAGIKKSNEEKNTWQAKSVYKEEMGVNRSKVLRCLYFLVPSPLLGLRPWSWPPICIYQPWLPIRIYQPWPHIYIYLPWPPICIYQLWLPTLCLPVLAPNLKLLDLTSTSCLPQICIYRISSGSTVRGTSKLHYALKHFN